LTSLRTGIMSGAPCPEHLMEKALNLMHLTEITICYGMTETSPVSFQTRRDAPISKRISSVGTVHPHVEVKIVDPETGKTVPLNTCGEIRVRGYSVMKGYWNEPEKNLEAIDCEGWMQTGDLGVIDSEGYCQIVGRSKDMILRGGENIYPREVEAFLYSHPDIQEVQCFGIPDAHYGEVMAAWVQLKANHHKNSKSFTLEALQQFCHGKISHQKIPVWIKIVDSFPMTATGKIQKYRMREESLKEIL
ncbi:MAG: AMP-binding protein, partial [Cyanobacteria bacterium]|nr:AMP-binding protein [Cyanobacteriota bacterium]